MRIVELWFKMRMFRCWHLESWAKRRALWFSSRLCRLLDCCIRVDTSKRRRSYKTRQRYLITAVVTNSSSMGVA